MRKICRLYGTETKTLCRSHIVPDFVIKKIQNTGSKYFRQFSQPNKRQQDGPKIELLSKAAEDSFSVFENRFKNQVFDPYLEDNSKEIEYDNNLYWFALSFLWRIIVIHLEHTPVLKRAPDLKKIRSC